MIEIGGTVGDYENVLFLEAARQLRQDGEKVIFVHIGYLPIPSHLGEMKTKPMQHSVKELQSHGIQPDFIITRANVDVDEPRRKKVALFCNVVEENVISLPDVDNIYEVPLILSNGGLLKRILREFGLQYVVEPADFSKWKTFVEEARRYDTVLDVGIVGKYFDTGDFSLTDSYISVIEAVKHACWHNKVAPNIKWINSAVFEENPKKIKSLKDLDALIVPGGFGSSAVEGKITAVKYARENEIPYLGLCYGLQLAVVEFARNVCGMKNAHTTEIDAKTKYPVVDILPEQIKNMEESNYGATMRLGGHKIELTEGSQVARIYSSTDVVERFRHRYEVNPKFVSILKRNGLVFSGCAPGGRIMQMMELPHHLFFVATQAHPEFKSRPMRPAPLFNGLIRAALLRRGVEQGKLKVKK